MSIIYDYDLQNFKQIEYLRQNLYPTLEKALDKLIDHIIQSNEVQNHQERLKQQRVQDRVEQKRIEKERLREELGSDYESSNDDELLDEMNDSDNAGNRSLSQHLENNEVDNIKGELDKQGNDEDVELAPVIEEEDDHGDSPDKANRTTLKSRSQSRFYKNINAYDPLEHLGKLLRELNHHKA